MDIPPHPQSLTIVRYASGIIKDIENGSTLADLKFKPNESLTVSLRN